MIRVTVELLSANATDRRTLLEADISNVSDATDSDRYFVEVYRVEGRARGRIANHVIRCDATDDLPRLVSAALAIVPLTSLRVPE